MVKENINLLRKEVKKSFLNGQYLQVLDLVLYNLSAETFGI
jgi:hypothetical protein